MVNIDSVKGDVFEKALQTRDVREFANAILNYKDDEIKGDFTLNFHGVTLTTEGCEFTNDFLVKNQKALLQLDRILEEEEKNKEKNVEANNNDDALDRILNDFVKGTRDLDLNIKNFVLNGSDEFDVRKKKIADRIKELNSNVDIDSLDLTEKEEKAKDAVENAKAIPDFDTIKEAVNIVDSLDNSDAKDALTNSIITFINNNIDNFEEKEELNNIVSTHQTNSELSALENELKLIDNEITNRKQIAIKIKEKYNEDRKTKKVASPKEDTQEETKVVGSENVTESSQNEVTKEPAQENNNTTEVKESNEDFIAKLENIANDGPIFQDLDLTAGYSYGAYKAAAEKKETKLENEFDNIIPDVDEEVINIVNNKKRKIVNISKASIALIEKVRNIDFKSKVNQGLEKFKELGSKVRNYIEERTIEYYKNRMNRAVEQQEKYAEKINNMTNKSNDPEIAIGMSR